MYLEVSGLLLTSSKAGLNSLVWLLVLFSGRGNLFQEYLVVEWRIVDLTTSRGGQYVI